MFGIMLLNARLCLPYIMLVTAHALLGVSHMHVTLMSCDIFYVLGTAHIVITILTGIQRRGIECSKVARLS